MKEKDEDTVHARMGKKHIFVKTAEAMSNSQIKKGRLERSVALDFVSIMSTKNGHFLPQERKLKLSAS